MSNHTVAPNRPFLLLPQPGDVCLPLNICGAKPERVLICGELYLLSIVGGTVSRTNNLTVQVWRAADGWTTMVHNVIETSNRTTGKDRITCKGVGSWTRMQDALFGIAYHLHWRARSVPPVAQDAALGARL